MSPKKQSRLALFIIFLTFSLLTVFMVGLYWQGLWGPYLLDDLQSIGPLQSDDLSLWEMLSLSFQNESGPLGRPLSVASFALNQYFFGSDPFSYKVTNLVLHLCMGVVVAYFIYCVSRITRQKKSRQWTLVALVTLLWLIHPLLVSTVLYPVQRMTILCHLFLLLSINCYIYARMKQLVQKRAWPFYALSVLNGLLAISAKETALLLPFYLFITEFCLLNFKTRYQSSNRHLKTLWTTLIALCAIAGIAYFVYRFHYFQNLYEDKPFTLLQRIFTQSQVLIFYLKQILFPNLASMGLYHDDYPITQHFNTKVLLSLSTITLALVMACVYRKRYPLMAFACLWFFVSHLIESTVLPLELVFEHRNYLASIGVLLGALTAYLAIYDLPKFRLKRVYTLIICCYIGLFLSLTWARIHTFSSKELFIKNTLAFQPNSPQAHIELANWFLENRQYQNAFGALEVAEALQPKNAGITLHKVLIHCHAVRLPNELLEVAKNKVKSTPITPYSILVLDQLVANIFEKNCNSISADTAIQIIHAAYQNPRIKHQPRYRAVLFHLEANLKMLTNNTSDALILLQRSYEAYPKRLAPLVTKAQLEITLQDIPAAQKTLRTLEQQYHKVYAPKTEINELKKAIEQ